MQYPQCDFRPGGKVSVGGGPVMTVKVATETMVYCVWLEAEIMKHGTFARDSLKCRCESNSIGRALNGGAATLP